MSNNQSNLLDFQKGNQEDTDSDQDDETPTQPSSTNESKTTVAPSPEGNSPSNNNSANNGDDSICPCYRQELEKYQDEVSELDLSELKCGHAIDYIGGDIGSKIATKTAKNYFYVLRRYVEGLHDAGITVCEAELQHIDDYMKSRTDLNRRKGTLRADRTAIINLHKHIDLYRDQNVATRWDRIQEEIDPSDYQTPAQIERTYLETDEIPALYKAMNSFRDRLMVHVGVELGPRNTDLRLITLERINLDERKIELTNKKSGGTYTLPINAILATLLRKWIRTERKTIPGAENNPYLFPSPEGGPLCAYQLRELIKEAADTANIQETYAKAELTEREQEALGTETGYKEFAKVTPHTLRHTFHQLLKEAGIGPEARSSAMDHENVETTKKYYDHDKEDHIDLMNEMFSGVNLDLGSALDSEE